MMTQETISDTVARLRIRIDDLMSRGTMPDVLEDTHDDWALIDRDVETLCAYIISADPDIAHSVLDELREMITLLNSVSFPMDN